MDKRRHKHWRDPLKHCEICTRILRRRRSEEGALERRDAFLARRTCSEKCRKVSLQVGQPAYNRRVAGMRASAEPVEAHGPPPGG